jgi:hypothetical protein
MLKPQFYKKKTFYHYLEMETKQQNNVIKITVALPLGYKEALASTRVQFKDTGMQNQTLSS